MSHKTLRRFGIDRSADAQLTVIGGTGTRRFSVCRRTRSHAEWFRRRTADHKRLCGFATANTGVRLDETIGLDLDRAPAVFDVFVDQYRVDVMT